MPKISWRALNVTGRKDGPALFRPKLLDTLKSYSAELLFKDTIAGIIVGIVALPLAIAFAIASGVSPEKGLLTAVIAGFIISALGGSRVQIGGPTGAFIVVVYAVIQQFGLTGLILATFIAGLLLMVMGILRLGDVIKFIPHPLITGFTAGIAVIIFSSQIRDLFGLKIDTVPADFLEKWKVYAAHYASVNLYALGIGLLSLAILLLWPKISRKIPGSLIVIILTTFITYYFKLPVETIGSRFGAIPSSFQQPGLPALSFATLQELLRPAFTIAILCGIESLLSAVVADGMTGGNHRSNTELIAQGAANIGSSLFGGIPATGAIARTATNIRNGARTPVAGIIHAITLLLIMLFVGQWAALVPLAALAGILVVVAYNMSEMGHFLTLLRGGRSDAAVLVVTFLLTVLIDLTVAIEVGMVLASFLFMRKMIRSSSVRSYGSAVEDRPDEWGGKYDLPPGVEIYEIHGPLFFGAAYKFRDAMKVVEKAPQVLIIRMRYVPVIDASGLRILKEVQDDSSRRGTKLILADVSSEEVMVQLRKSRLLFRIGGANVTSSLDAALKRAREILSADKGSQPPPDASSAAGKPVRTTGLVK